MIATSRFIILFHKRIQNIGSFLVGDRTNMSYDKYFMTLTCLSAASALFIIGPLNIIFNPAAKTILVSSISTIMIFVLYLIVRLSSCLKFPKIILTVLGLLMLDLTWYKEYMSYGALLFFIFAFGSLIVWLWNGRALIFTVLFYFLNLAALFYIEYNTTNLDISEYIAQNRIFDVYIGFMVYVGLAIYLLGKAKVDFVRQQRIAIKSEQLKTAFLTNMSHEIRTPMNAIHGFSDLLIKEKSREKQEEYVANIHASGYNLLSLMDDIMDLSNLDSGGHTIHKTQFYVEDIFRELLEVNYIELGKRNRGNINLKYKLPDGNIKIFFDQHRLRQILSNLILNAIKFTVEGEIIFTCEYVNKEIIFSVSDTGIGIAEEDQSKIFNRFVKYNPQNLNTEGTGIGLSIASKLTKLLDGKIWINSEEGKGSVFYVSFPRHINEIMPIDIIKKSSASSKKVSQKKKNILIVEDDPLSAKLLDKIFENSNYNIEHVGDGPDAIEFLKTAKSDIVLMDIKLPSLSGFKTVEEIRKFNKSIPIIAQTANAIYNDREKAREVGFTDYLLKPIDAEELLNIIKKYS